MFIRSCMYDALNVFLFLMLPSGWGSSFILARYLQHRAEDGWEREETADGTRIPYEDRGWTPRNLPGRAGTEMVGKGQAVGEGAWGWIEIKRQSGREGERTGWVVMMDWEYEEEEGKLVEVSTLELIPLGWAKKNHHMVTRDTNNVASSSTGSCSQLSNKALIFFSLGIVAPFFFLCVCVFICCRGEEATWVMWSRL